MQRSSTLLALLAIAPLVASAQSTPSEDALTPDPAIVFGELENGLRYAILPNPEPPDRISLRLHVGAGSLQEEENERGLMHYLEHMAFNGTENYGAEEMVEYFQRLGMAFGGDTNAFTSFDRTVYMLELPETDAELVDDALLLLRDWAGGMLLKTEEIDNERGVIVSEMIARDSVDYRNLVERINFYFPEALFRDRLPIGVPWTIAKANKRTFETLYERWYRPDNMIVVAVGAVETEAMAEAIEAQFGDLDNPNGPLMQVDLGKVTEAPLRFRFHPETEANNVEIIIGMTESIENPVDSPDQRRRALVRDLADSILSQRLSEATRRPGSPIIRGFAYNYEWYDMARFSGVQVTATPEDWEGAFALVEQEWRRALEFGVTEAELTEAVANYRNQLEQAVRAAPTRDSRALASALTSSLGSGDTFTHPEQDLALLEPVLDSVTVEAVNAAFRSDWSANGPAVFVSGPLDLEGAEAAFAALWSDSQSVGVTAPEDGNELEFAYANLGAPGSLRERQHHDDLEITQIVFENEVRASLKQTDYEADQILVTFRFGNGVASVPEEKAGIHLLASQTFIEGGLEAHTVDDLRRLFAGKNVSTSFNANGATFSLSGATNGDDLIAQLQLLTAYLVAPAYRQEAVDVAQRAFDDVYKRSLHTPQGILGDRVIRELASGDHRFGLPPQEKLTTLSAQDIREWLESDLERAFLEVSVVGDFEVEAVIGALAQTVGTLPQRDAKAEGQLPYADEVVLASAHGDVQHLSFSTEIPKGLAIAVWPTSDLYNITEARRLNVLAEIFGDRLRKEVRERLGDTYSPAAFNSPSDIWDDFGYLMGAIICDPEDAERLTAIMVDIAQDLQGDSITQDEFERAVTPQLKSIEQTVRNNAYWLNNVLANSHRTPERLDWARSFRDDYGAITLAEVRSLANSVFEGEAVLQYVIIPEESENQL